jgi:hypothetical protein
MVTRLDAALGDLGRVMGIEGLAFDPYGLCRLGFETVAVDLQRSADGRRLLVSCLAGELPETGAAGAMRRLLEANAFFRQTRGATIGLTTGGSGVIVAREIGAGIEADGLRRVVEGFLDVVETVRRLLAEPAEVEDGADPMTMLRV